ncbi:ImmA/IrrE family metallo-endopeptidase [bacterium]|nr:ImmA/IrrE family metallo-endopeptidase [bacterium]
MTDRTSLGRIAMHNALQLRRTLSVPRESPVNAFDVANALGVEVRFVDRPSLEGMFFRGPNPKVLLPSWTHRPTGRIYFSCAHELGHFRLGHGTHVDEYIEGMRGHGPKSDNEFSADTFATSLLMPRQAVLTQFTKRGWEVTSAGSVQLYMVAGELGVGFSTLLKHLRYGLKLTDEKWLTSNLRAKPKEIRQDVIGETNSKRLVIVDEKRANIPIDIEVGDEIAVPRDLVVKGNSTVVEVGHNSSFSRWTGTCSGISEILINGLRHHVRIARPGFCGMLKYRFLEDPEDL